MRPRPNWQASGLSAESFAVYWLLKGQEVSGAKKIAHQMGVAFAAHPHWRASEQQEREVRTALYKALLGEKVDHITEVAGWLLTVLKRRSA